MVTVPPGAPHLRAAMVGNGAPLSPQAVAEVMARYGTEPATEYAPARG